MFSSGPKKRISGSGRLLTSTILPLIPGVLPGMRRSMMDCETISQRPGKDIKYKTHIDVFLETMLNVGA